MGSEALQLQVPSFFNNSVTPFGFIPAPHFVKPMCFIDMPCYNLCGDGQEKYFFIAFFPAEIERQINKPVSVSAFAHFRLQHEEAQLCGIIIPPGNGDASGRNAVALQYIQAVGSGVIFVRKFIDDMIHIGGEHVRKMALRIIKRLMAGITYSIQ